MADRDKLDGVSTQDAYVEALTLGPFPGVMESADITVDGADVLMEFAIGKTGSNYWKEGVEYPMRPGTRRVDGVCGVRFRSRLAGQAASVTATLTGPGMPRFAPVTPLVPAGLGDPLLQLTNFTILPAQTVQLGTFDVGEWPAILIVCSGGGVKITADYQVIPGGILDAYRSLELTNAAGAQGSLVVPNLGATVAISATGASVGGADIDLVVCPCAITSQAYSTPSAKAGRAQQLTLSARPLIANGSETWLINPFQGRAITIFRGLTGGPYNVTLDGYDYNGNLGGAFGGRLIDEQATQGFTIEHPLLPASMGLTVQNTAGVLGTYNLSTIIEELAA